MSLPYDTTYVPPAPALNIRLAAPGEVLLGRNVLNKLVLLLDGRETELFEKHPQFPRL